MAGVGHRTKPDKDGDVKMTKVTCANVKLENGNQIEADTLGNNNAILCPNCKKQPILLIALKYQKGSDINNPATCKACGKSYSIISNLNANELTELILKEH